MPQARDRGSSHAGTAAIVAATVSMVDATSFVGILGKVRTIRAGASVIWKLSFCMISNMALKFTACPPCSSKAAVTLETDSRNSLVDEFIAAASSGTSVGLTSWKALL
eukprot:CAMPEP_0181464074 /NCGR_PEP_ID=MMETSP1110-20121109/35241_1 /TAXON_ID=174948 /ORGANISM="Symbiodinium sp., Strain CCMP421" /LENGTH=107 /DNA_ID=CAMNT_0023588789 /DNA_START=179 /DNA_END=502 /DNA_ORIENTATION=-